MRAVRWEHRWGAVALPLLALVGLVVADALFGERIVLSATYGIAAVLASAITTVRRTAVVALLAVLAALASALWNGNGAAFDWFLRVGLTVLLSGLAVLTALMRARRERALQHMTVIAETAQRAVLRALPTAVGSVGFAARYVSATESAQVGGDLYEVAETPYGVRVIVGDVRGKGLDAVQMAATVLAAFRRAAFVQPSLPAIAADLDRVVTAVAGDEDFVTALLAEFHEDESVTLANCGHHPPLLVNAGDGPRALETGDPTPPLGLGAAPAAVRASWPPGSRVLIFTDGLVEARDRRGTFFPLAEQALVLDDGSVDEALDRLLSALDEHADHRLADDIALVLAEHRGAVTAATP